MGVAGLGYQWEKRRPKLRSVSETFLQKYERESAEVAEIEILARINSAGKWLIDSLCILGDFQRAILYFMQGSMEYSSILLLSTSTAAK